MILSLNTRTNGEEMQDKKRQLLHCYLVSAVLATLAFLGIGGAIVIDGTQIPDSVTIGIGFVCVFLNMIQFNIRDSILRKFGKKHYCFSIMQWVSMILVLCYAFSKNSEEKLTPAITVLFALGIISLWAFFSACGVIQKIFSSIK